MSDKKPFKQRNKRIIRVPDESDYNISCFCVMETRNEDFTLRSLGQELTRNIELEVCWNCKERYIPGQIASDMQTEIEAKVLSLAKQRLEVPSGHTYLRYYKETDVLIISYSNNASLKSKRKSENNLVYNFDYQGNLVNIEVLNFYGKSMNQ